MGEVYRATDQKLGREVAIKVLPEEVVGDPPRLARFEREARALASLNHPNVAAIHGLEEADGGPFLVLELVEGEDLAERLARGPIPVDEAIEIARQIAEALEEAHATGIVHRDLKPANVKVTPDDKVKVLDFGLAKACAAPEDSFAADGLSQSPTLARTGTRAGVILGTAAYMSPEQASGRTVDRRADIWSFGVVLFEMLTARRPFTGATTSETLASVIEEDPPWDALPPDCPPRLTRLLRRCLQKRLRQRLHDIADARLELEDLQGGVEEGAGASNGGVDAARQRRDLRRERWVWGAALVVAVGVAAVVGLLHFAQPPQARPVAHLVIDTPQGVALGANRGFITLPAVSPDGRHVAFVGRRRGSPPQVWVRPLDAPEARALPGTEGAAFPFWSPDGREVGFGAEGELRKLDLDGARVERVCTLPGNSFRGGTWNHEGTIVFSSGYPTPSLYTVQAAGGAAQPLTTLDASRGEQGHHSPRFLPDGRHVLFRVVSAQAENRGLYVASVGDSNQRRRILAEERSAEYSSGYLLFVQSGALFAQPFDARRLEVSGEAVRVAERVNSYWLGALGLFGVSSGGILAYLDHAGDPMVQLTWLDRTGRPLGPLGEPRRYFEIALSPDGRRVVSDIWDHRGGDLWVIDVSRGVESRLTNDPRGEANAVWSPDSQEVAFAMMLEGGPHIYRTGLGGGASAHPVLETPGEKWPEDWSRHGDTVLYLHGGAFWALSLAGDAEPEKILETGARLDEPRLSPDGRWLAYTSDLSGGWETYVEPFRRPGGRVRVSVDGGGQPSWRADGKELFFISRRNRLTAVEVQEGADGLEVGLPNELFEVPIVTRAQLNEYGVSPDGQRFLVKVPVEDDSGERIHVVTNWTSLLE